MAETDDYYSDAATSADIDLLLSSISKLSNVAFFVWNDEDGRPLYISSQLAKFYRLSMADFMARFPNEQLIAANMVGDDGVNYLAISGTGNYELEFRAYRSDGTIGYAREVGENIVDPVTKRVLRSAGAVIDITAMKETEQALKHRTEELSRSLEDLRTAQDRLVQTEKLASLGQLTAGIAHEIKNPLNFVNNFSSLSTELVDELSELLANASLDGNLREEASELIGMLKGNLDKVLQHGRRADSIVKNMLLHSRHGSGEHRPVNVNAVVEESLNLAYHGARAERKEFNITLERQLDPEAGEADIYPQEITRVLLNLMSNGFYATGKRAAEARGEYDPMLWVGTKNLGHAVEITIRDNGTGIPPEVKEKMFNPFFTTKPAGEGTGLGLSLSHDIVVKQHAGRIEVDTEPGRFTEFKIVLPRNAADLGKKGGAM